MIEWSMPKSGRSPLIYLSVSVNKAGHKEASKPHSLCIRISAKAAADLRLIAGDRAFVGIDRQTKQVCFKRTTDYQGSYCISGKTATSKGVLVIQCATDLPWCKSISVDKESITEANGVVCIDAPKIFGQAKK